MNPLRQKDCIHVLLLKESHNPVIGVLKSPLERHNQIYVFLNQLCMTLYVEIEVIFLQNSNVACNQSRQMLRVEFAVNIL